MSCGMKAVAAVIMAQQNQSCMNEPSVFHVESLVTGIHHNY